MRFEIYLRSDLKKPILKTYYKTYKGAFSRLLKDCNKPLTNDYQKVLANNTILVIRDDTERVICNSNYSKEDNRHTIVQTNNIGHILKILKINH